MSPRTFGGVPKGASDRRLSAPDPTVRAGGASITACSFWWLIGLRVTAAPMSRCPDLARKEHANILLFNYLVVFVRAPGFVDCCRSAMLRGGSALADSLRWSFSPRHLRYRWRVGSLPGCRHTLFGGGLAHVRSSTQTRARTTYPAGTDDQPGRSP